MIIGGLAGLVVATAYAATAGWLCSGIRACPVSWEPFAVVATIIFVVITVAGVVVAVVGAKLYRVFDTALASEGTVTTIIPGTGGSDTISESDSSAFSERSESGS